MAYPHVDLGDTLKIARSYSCTTSICPCQSFITAHVSRIGAVTMTSTTVEFECIIHSNSVLCRSEFMGKSLDNPRCAHDLSSCFRLTVTADQWDHVCAKDPHFVVVCASYSPDKLDVTKGNAGVVPLSSGRRPSQIEHGVKACELFCGGFSGWTHVCRTLTKIGHDIQVRAAIDHDEQCIRAYCKSHHVEHFVESPNCAWGSHDLPAEMAICAKVESNEWCHLLGIGTIDMMFISPPCPPWSWASAFEGLNREEGRLTLHAWGKIAILGPRVVCMEMVGAMTDHPHWFIITEFIKWTVYTIKWYKVASLRDVAPHKRERLILVAISSTCEKDLAPHRCTMWPKVPPFNLQNYQAIFDLGPPWSVQAFPSSRVLQMYLNPELLPKPSNEHGRPLKRTKKDVQSYRIRFPTDMASCIMANYSYAHMLPFNVLHQRGLFGALLMSSKGIRFLALPEIVALFTATNDLWLPADNRVAVHIMGNAITIPHAALGVCNGLAFINDELSQVDVQELILEVFSFRLNSGNMTWKWEDEGIRFYKMQESEDENTLPMHEFFQITVLTPTQKYRLSCEEGVRVTQAIQILTGPSNPSQLSMTVGNQYQCKFALPKGFCMPRDEVTLFSGVPSVIMVDKQHVHQVSDEVTCVVVLTPSGVCLLQRISDMTVGQVAQIVRSQHPNSQVPYLMNIGGENLPDNRICPTCVISMDEPVKSCDITILSLLRIQLDGNVISFRGSDPTIKGLIEMMQQSGLQKLLLTMGWMMISPISDEGALHSDEIQLIPKPNHLALITDDVLMFLTTRLFVCCIHQTVTVDDWIPNDKVFLRLKLWETCVWEGLVSADFHFLPWINTWRDIAKCFALNTRMRFVVNGRQINPEWSCRAFVNCESGVAALMTVHCVMSLHGGGGSEEHPSPVTISPENASPHQSRQAELRALEIQDFSGAITVMLAQWIRARPHHIETRLREIESAFMREEDNMITIQGDTRCHMAFLQIFHDHGVTKLLHEFGWIPVLQFLECHQPIRTRILIFPQPGRDVVSSSAIRSFIHAVVTVIALPSPYTNPSTSVLTKIKLWGEPVFHAWLPRECRIEAIHDAWSRGCLATAQHIPVRVVCQSKVTNPDFQLRHYAKRDRDGHMVATLHFVVALQGGAGNTVREANVHQSNALATFLLQENCDFQDVAAFVKKVIDGAGHQAIQDVLTAKSAHVKWQHLHKLADALKLSMPNTITKAANRRKKTQEKFRNASKAIIDDLQPHNFVINEGFFLNDDGTPCMQQKVLTPNSTGVVVMKGPEAMQWIQKAQTLSQDELGIVVVGPCPCHEKNRCRKIQIPAHDISGHPVVLSACFHDVGRKAIQVDSKHDAKIPIQDTVIISWTVYRDEVGNEQWDQLVSAPVKKTLEWALGQNHDLVFSAPPWGRTYQRDRVKVQPHEATSMQFHSRVNRGQLQRVLKASGNAGVYVNMKTETKQISPDYQVVWLSMNMVDLTCTAATFSNHCGIVRNNNRNEAKINRGLRFHKDDFEGAFKQLKPTDDVPVIVAPNFLYKISPIPVGANADHIQQWLGQQKWNAKPLRVLGNQTWLIASSSEISQEFGMWNGNSLLIKQVHGRQHRDPIIVAGTIPKPVGSKDSSHGEIPTDPWAEYRSKHMMSSKPASSGNTNSLPPAVTRKLEGPIETRFQRQQQDIQNVREATKDIEQIKQDMAKLKDAVDLQQKSQEQHRHDVQQDFQRVRKETTDQVNALSVSFQESLANSAAQQEQAMMKQFADLKAMLSEKPVLQAHKKAKAQPTSPSEADL